VQLLLNVGADPGAVEGTGKTAAYWARQRNHTKIAEQLEALSPPPPAKPAEPEKPASRSKPRRRRG
jgi:hypothetical protein